MKMKLVAAMLMMTAGVDAEAALWGPTWSEVTGSRWSKVTMNRAPAIIKSVDGRNYLDRVVKIDPGARAIVVQSPSRGGFMGRDRELKVDVKPCTRYYINAQFASSVGPEWEPVIAKEEKIPGCKVTAPKR